MDGRIVATTVVLDDQIYATARVVVSRGHAPLFVCHDCSQAAILAPMNDDDRSARWARVRDFLELESGAGTPRKKRIAALVDAIWAEFGDHRPVSWVGYYELGDGEMTLGYRRDKPACSPIGLHGACGQAALSGRSLIVPDVRELGEGYIACDPRDLSELVVPVRNSEERVVGVLDLDSYAAGAFGAADQDALEDLVRAALC